MELVNDQVRLSLVKLGARFSDRALDHLTSVVTLASRWTNPSSTQLRSALSYLIVGRWLDRHGMRVRNVVADRYKVFDAAVPHFGEGPILYAEFGVWAGESLRYWSNLLSGRDAVLHGFDSFEGLPEAWAEHSRGTFSTDGAVPEIDDDRVKFFVGWFNETLKSYRPPEHDLLIVNCDADLYASTQEVLAALNDIIVTGSLVYFDEFNDVDHEFLAFDEYVRRTGKKFEIVATTPQLTHVMFRCTEAEQT
jgi:hypothetical protein